MSTSTEQTSTPESKTETSEKVTEAPTPASNGLNLSSGTFVNGNHDDLSLPELPTSECTPLSTTLNTPNHSDNEEESSGTRDARSSLINFAHSPIKLRKTSAGDELQFDFQNDASESSKDKSTDNKQPEDKQAHKGKSRIFVFTRAFRLRPSRDGVRDERCTPLGIPQV